MSAKVKKLETAMSESYNVYCDESCHLENDRQPVMVFGSIWCPKSKVPEISSDIKAIKKRHRASGELKWTKVSPAKLPFYMDLIDFFFGQDELNFRGLIVTNKQDLNHSYFNEGSHDSFYYKMYYQMLMPVLKPPHAYNVYLDIKDTRSADKVRFLREVLCNKLYDFDRTLIPIIQNIRSGESHLLQLADFFTGAVGYRSRLYPGKSKAKSTIVETISHRNGRDLVGCTPLWEEKFNLFSFSPRRIA
jgi:hypothetical protein